MEHKIYSMNFERIYTLYLNKIARKNRTKAEMDQIIYWLTGHDAASLALVFQQQLDVKTFFKSAPHLNPLRKLITGSICGIRVEEIQEPLLQEIRYLDKLIDELAKGKSLKTILKRQ